MSTELVITDSGVDAILEQIFKAGYDLSLRLFSNNYIPSRISSLSNLVESVGGGYAAKTLSGNLWIVDNSTIPHKAAYPQQTFTFTGNLTTNPHVYGYFVTDANDTLIWAQLLDAYFTPASNGDEIIVVPSLPMGIGVIATS